MKDNLRKAFLLGLGALNYSERKYSELFDDLMKEGESKEKESEEFFNGIKQEFEKNQGKFRQNLEEELRKLVKSMGLVTQEEFRKVKRELNALKKKVKERENQKPEGEKK